MRCPGSRADTCRRFSVFLRDGDLSQRKWNQFIRKVSGMDAHDSGLLHKCGNLGQGPVGLLWEAGTWSLKPCPWSQCLLLDCLYAVPKLSFQKEQEGLKNVTVPTSSDITCRTNLVLPPPPPLPGIRILPEAAFPGEAR